VESGPIVGNVNVNLIQAPIVSLPKNWAVAYPVLRWNRSTWLDLPYIDAADPCLSATRK
jgi:hypothetical protein